MDRYTQLVSWNRWLTAIITLCFIIMMMGGVPASIMILAVFGFIFLLPYKLWFMIQRDRVGKREGLS